MGMKNEKKGFFSRMLSSEHKVFETSMFGISVVLTLALVIGIGYYISVAFFNHNTVTDEEANASAVSDSAVTVRESPEPTQTPDENTMIREDDADTQVDEELAKATEGYTTSTVNMRSEPSLTASVVAKVPASTKLTFSGLQKKEWMEVEYNGQKGYINAMYLSVDKPKPIETVTPRPTQTPVRTTATPKATKVPTDKRNAARYTYITGHQIVKVQPVDGRIKEFLEYQYHHRTRITNEIQCNNEKAHIPFYLEASDEALEKECLETKVDCVERQALEKQPHHRRQPQSRIIESHET